MGLWCRRGTTRHAPHTSPSTFLRWASSPGSCLLGGRSPRRWFSSQSSPRTAQEASPALTYHEQYGAIMINIPDTGSSSDSRYRESPGHSISAFRKTVVTCQPRGTHHRALAHFDPTTPGANVDL